MKNDGDFERDVSHLLGTVDEIDADAQEELFEAVYGELKKRAKWERWRWKGEPSLQTTALVNEAYLKLVKQENQTWENRSHFFAVAAKAMRHILINHARRKRAEKRGGDAPKLSLEKLRESMGREVALTEERAEVLVALDNALKLFEDEQKRASHVVECRFFAGMTIEETAEALDISTATVSRDWNLAQAWLYREMKAMMA